MPTNRLKEGDATPIGFALGDKTITKMYLGDTLIYEGIENVDLKSYVFDPGDITFDTFDNLLD